MLRAPPAITMTESSANLLNTILKAPFQRVLNLVSFVLVLMAFVDVAYETGGWHGKLVEHPRPVPLVLGVAGLVGSIVWIWWTHRKDRKEQGASSTAARKNSDQTHDKHKEGLIDKEVDLVQGLSIQLDRIDVLIRAGNIVTVGEASDRAAVILPANTSFIDDCITERHAALGAFVLHHYPDRIAQFREAVTTRLPTSSDNTWPPGTTVLLPREFDVGVKILVTASTEREARKGIHTEPTTILACIREIFAQTADDHLEVLRMPVLGSGHGGLDIHSAVLFLLLGIQHYGRAYHHVKKIEIVVRAEDATNFGVTANRLAYVARLQEKKV
jgi:hypothetical protein